MPDRGRKSKVRKVRVTFKLIGGDPVLEDLLADWQPASQGELPFKIEPLR